MECAKIRGRFSEYVNDYLGKQDKAVVEAHLMTCKGCRKELSNVKALVHELGTLYSVKEPADFLENIHKRTAMRSREDSVKESGMERRMRKLFVPWHIKIPLKLATVAAALVLVLAVYNVQVPQKEIDTHQASDSQAFPQRTSEDLIGGQERAESGSPFGVLDTPAQEIKKAPIELALLLGQESVQEEDPFLRESHDFFFTLHGQTGDSSEVPGESLLEATRSAETLDREGSSAFRSTLPVYERVPLGAAEIEDIRAQILEFVIQAGGSFLPPRLEKLDVPPVIYAEIPWEQYSGFCEELKKLGTFQIPPPMAPETDEQTVSLLIRLIPSK